MSTPTARSTGLRSAARPALLLTAVAAGLALTLTGCSGSGSSAAGAAPSTGTGQRAGGQRQPGVSGLIAEVSGKTLQVQGTSEGGTSEQAAVTWTDKTTFTDVRKASAAALKTGLCASIRTAAASASPGTTMNASSVALSPAVGGTCAGGFELGGARPSGGPSGAARSGAPGYDRGTNGKVTSVDGATFVVAATGPGGSTTTAVTVTTTTSTAWSELAKTTAKAATVGRCATATGTSSGTGALTATAVRLSAPASDGTCAAFGGDRRPGQPGQGSTANG